MGWFSRVIVNAVEPGDECFYDTAPRGTVHGSKGKNLGSRAGGMGMKANKKPDGFFHKDRRRP